MPHILGGRGSGACDQVELIAPFGGIVCSRHEDDSCPEGGLRHILNMSAWNKQPMAWYHGVPRGEGGNHAVKLEVWRLGVLASKYAAKGTGVYSPSRFSASSFLRSLSYLFHIALSSSRVEV